MSVITIVMVEISNVHIIDAFLKGFPECFVFVGDLLVSIKHIVYPIDPNPAMSAHAVSPQSGHIRLGEMAICRN